MVRSIRWRLQFWYAAMLAGVIGGFGGLVYWQSRSAQLKHMDTRLLASASYLDAILRVFPPMDLESARGDSDNRPPPDRGPGMDKGPPFDKGGGRGPDGPPPERNFDRGPRGGPGGPRRPPERLLEDLDLRKAANSELPEDGEPAQFIVWRADRSVLKTSDAGLAAQWPEWPSSAGSLSGAPQFVQHGDDRAVVTLGPRRTAILVAKPIGRELAELNQLIWRLAGAGGAALAIGLVGGWWMSSRVLRPIRSISRAAAAISATQLSERIDTAKIDRELAELATVLNGTFARLEEEFQKQTRFTADASHELRTPLAVLHSQLELALARPRTPEEYEEALERCRNATSRMRGLVDGLLMLARADAGKLAIDRQPLDLRELVEEIVNHPQPAARKSEVALTFAAPEQSVMVAGHATLSRVLENLLSNALRHTPQGGSVTVSLTSADQAATLRVTDTGSGIPLADQPRIFERFFRADQARSRSSGGNGLGLAICKSIVEAHDGTIAFTSEPGVKTEFVVTLPMVRQELNHRDTEAQRRQEVRS
jgi:two-component system, OmpR family, sensor kinase